MVLSERQAGKSRVVPEQWIYSDQLSWHAGWRFRSITATIIEVTNDKE
jgi:hypothetical protein